jgi:hypothetical protein
MAEPKRKGSILSAMGWIFLISILLFWLPVLGPLIAGIVGGKKAGGLGAAIAAVFLPIVVTGAALFFFSTALIGLPLIGAFVGLGASVFLAAHVGPLLLGAIVGGLLA